MFLIMLLTYNLRYSNLDITADLADCALFWFSS